MSGARRARAHVTWLLVDNTFLPPVESRPGEDCNTQQAMNTIYALGAIDIPHQKRKSHKNRLVIYVRAVKVAFSLPSLFSDGGGGVLFGCNPIGFSRVTCLLE